MKKFSVEYQSMNSGMVPKEYAPFQTAEGKNHILLKHLMKQHLLNLEDIHRQHGFRFSYQVFYMGCKMY